MNILISLIYSKNTNEFSHNDKLIQIQYWADKVKIINKHKHNTTYCINIKIEDHILKYRVYPKQYQSWYQTWRFPVTSHIQRSNFSKEIKPASKYISSMSLFSHSISIFIKIPNLYNTISLSIPFSHQCYMQYYRIPITIKENQISFSSDTCH